MKVAELLKHAVVINQSICFDCNCGVEDIEKFSSWLEMSMRCSDIPHWRPVAFTIAHQESSLSRDTLSQNPVLGTSPSILMKRFSESMVMGEFENVDLNKWGYVNSESDYEDNTFTGLYGFDIKVDTENGSSKKMRTRKILTCSEDEIKVTSLRIYAGDNSFRICSNDFITYSNDTTGDTTCGANVKKLDNLYGNVQVYEYDADRVGNSKQGIKMTTSLFVVIFKKGSKRVTAQENSNIVIKECRDSFCFGDVSYDINDLFYILNVDRNGRKINIEYKTDGISEKQLQAILRNA